MTAGSPCHLTVRLLWWYPALTSAGGWPVLCAPNSRCRRTGLLGGPLLERWTPRQGAAGAVVPHEPVLCLDKSNTHVHSGTARYVHRCPCSGGRVRVRNWRCPEGGRWSGRDTSCGTVVLQRSLVLSSGPKRQKRTRVGLLCCCCGVPHPNSRHIFGFVLVRTWASLLLLWCATSK